MKTYRVGMLGFGFIGKVHAYGYQNLPFYYDPLPLCARITHVAASRTESAEKARQTLGAEVATTDYRAITENPAIDIVDICTPNHLHKEALLSAIRHQKHIYCDKPLVATMAEAEEIEAALADYRGTAQMTFQNRFYPATMRAKQLVDEGVLGQVLSFRIAYLHGGSANPDAPLKWKLAAAAGGGVIADLASHVLDLADWLIGPFGSVMAATQIAYPERPSAADRAKKLPVDTEDSVVLLARMASGALGTIEATKIATGSEDELRLELHGSPGRCAITAWTRTTWNCTTPRRRTGRWAACGDGTGSTPASAIRPRQPVSPPPKRRPAGCAATRPAWETFCKRWPTAGPPSPTCDKAFACSG